MAPDLAACTLQISLDHLADMAREAGRADQLCCPTRGVPSSTPPKVRSGRPGVTPGGGSPAWMRVLGVLKGAQEGLSVANRPTWCPGHAAEHASAAKPALLTTPGGHVTHPGGHLHSKSGLCDHTPLLPRSPSCANQLSAHQGWRKASNTWGRG